MDCTVILLSGLFPLSCMYKSNVTSVADGMPMVASKDTWSNLKIWSPSAAIATSPILRHAQYMRGIMGLMSKCGDHLLRVELHLVYLL